MIDVFKVFYTTHYNIAALAVLILFLFILFATKKNFRGMIIVGAILIAMNLFIFKRTDGKAWTLTIEPEKPAVANDYGYEKPQPITMTFSARKNWKITDETGKVHHWCWVDQMWENFASMDLVSALWGDNKSKKMMKATETRLNEMPE